MRYWLPLSVFCGLLISTANAADPVSVQYGKDPKQSLNVYRSTVESKEKLLPVVIWVHGGGWRTGDKDNRAGEADLIIAKHRNGPTAEMMLIHQGHMSRFTEPPPDWVSAAVQQPGDAPRE